MLVLFVLYTLILYRGHQSNSSLPVEGHKLKNEKHVENKELQIGMSKKRDVNRVNSYVISYIWII